jgi:protein-tyrosine-phosphatase
MKPKKILFLCKYNAFRSRIAEEYFKKTSKGKNPAVISRGFIMGGASDMVQRMQAKKILGIDIAKRKPLPVRISDLKEADLIVAVADDIPKIMFNYGLSPIARKVVFWNVKDEEKMDEGNIRKIIMEIKKNVDRLSRQLEESNGD